MALGSTTNLQASDALYTNGIQLTWTYSGGDAPTAWYIYRAGVNEAPVQIAYVNGNTNSYLDQKYGTGLGFYTYYVVPIKYPEIGAPSDSDVGSLRPPTFGAVLDLQASDGISDGDINLTWSYSGGDEPDGWYIYRWETGGVPELFDEIEGDARSYSDYFTEGVKHYYVAPYVWPGISSSRVIGPASNSDAGWMRQTVGSTGDDWLAGGPNADTIRGYEGNDYLWGGDSNDTLIGGDDHDTLDGASGNDILYGGLGRDGMTGGPGADKFFFFSAADANGDVVYFVRTEGDKINLAGIDADPDNNGNQKFSWAGKKISSAFTGDDGELRLKGSYLQGDLDGDRHADFSIKIIGPLGTGDVIL